MVFNEVYSAYYKAISKMLKYAIKKELNKELMYKIIKEVAFEESSLNIVPAIEKEEWQLLTKELKTPIVNEPALCLTGIEREWLKTILSDPKAALFYDKKEELKEEGLLKSDQQLVTKKYLSENVITSDTKISFEKHTHTEKQTSKSKILEIKDLLDNKTKY